MTGQQITSLTAAMGELILDTMSKSNIRRHVMEQRVYQLLLDIPLDEKQFNFSSFQVIWYLLEDRTGRTEAICVSTIYSSFTQAKGLVVVESVQGFCTNLS